MVMMKFLKTAALALAVLGACLSCGKKEKALDITGEWNLVALETRAASIGDQTVDVYISFASSGTFEMYQMLGTGRYRKYSGTWTLTGSTLTGKYSDGTQWGSSYEVGRRSEDMLTLSSASGEIGTYKKSTIPASVRGDAL